MKIAVFSDLHAHNFREFDNRTEQTGSQRLDNIVQSLLYIRRYCEEHGITHVLFGGDLFHVRSKVNTIVFNAIYDTIKSFSEHGIELVMIAGNHDQHDNSDVPQHSLHAFSDLPNVHVYGDLGIHGLYDGDQTVDIYCVPYSKNAKRIKDWLLEQEEMTTSGGRYSRICLFHLGISGGFVGKGNYPLADAFEVEDLRPDFFKYIVGGHFHSRQMLGGHNHVLYTGAPIQHSFGDEGEDKGFYVLDTSKRCDIKFVPIPNPKFLTVTSHKVANEDMERVADEGHYVRLQVTESELPVALTYLPQHLRYKVELQKEYKEETRVDVKIGMSFQEIISKYAEEFYPEGKEVGLKILSEIDESIN